MSHSPDEISRELSHEDLDKDFLDSLLRLNKMLDQGVSWSGNERNCCFLNTGAQRFANVSSVTGLDFLDDGRGIALTDWDHDGDLDLWTSNRNAPRVRFMRNDMPAGQHFLTLRLTGSQCNRDAIGARVEVRLAGEDARPRIRTLRAGDAFLSQSSKTIHLGLGASEGPADVIVRWPDRSVEEFGQLAVDRHYQLVQGRGEALSIELRRRKDPLVNSRPKIPAQGGPIRTLLSEPIPLPRLAYKKNDGSEAELTAHQHSGLLINLWASWCRPCAAELREFAQHADKLRAAGLRIVALSVDGLGDQRAGKQAASSEFLERIEFPFDSGNATDALIGQLELIVNFVYGPDRPLPVPTSLLIDSDGRLAAIYKGPLEVAQLARDVALLDAKEDVKFLAAMPFAGQWLGRPGRLSLMDLLTAFVIHGHEEQAIQYATQMVDRLSHYANYPKLLTHLATKLRERDANSRAAKLASLAVKVDPDQVDAHLLLANLSLAQGEKPAAIRYFQRVTELTPDLAEARFHLGQLYAESGKLAAAAIHLERYLRHRPDDASTHANLGVIYARQRQLDRAEKQLRIAVDLQPDDAMARSNLGRVLQDQGSEAEAVAEYRLALAAKQAPLVAALNLSSILAKSKDPAVRNHVEAIRLAEQCAGATQHKRPDILKKLAEAYAAAGRWQEAVDTTRKAIQLARAGRLTDLSSRLDQMLRTYQEELPSTAR